MAGGGINTQTPRRWSADALRWYLDASAYTGFHQKLAALLLPRLDAAHTLCDLGCGPGRLDLALAPHLGAVTAVDSDPLVAEALRRDAESAGCRNLRVVCGQAETLPGRYDVALMSFFGRAGEDFARYLPLAGKLLVRIVNSENRGRLYPDAYRSVKKDTAPLVRQELAALGLRYEVVESELEFGQPLKSAEEARRFVAHRMGVAANPRTAEAFLAQNLRPTGEEKFPFYLPNPKAIAIFFIQH